MGAKGGVGTTTVAVNVGAALAKSARVIVCELQPTGGFQSYFATPPQLTISSLRRLGFHPEAVRASLTEIGGNLSLLAATSCPGEYLDLAADEVRKLVRILADLADYVVLDLPPEPSPATKAAVMECDRVSLVVDRDPASMKAGSVVVSMLRTLGVRQASVGAVTVNRGATASEPLSEVRARIGCDLIGVVPPAGTSCYLSQRLGRPFVTLQPKEVVSVAIAGLADRLRAPTLKPLPLS